MSKSIWSVADGLLNDSHRPICLAGPCKAHMDRGHVLWVEDLKSANGTFINGIRIEKGALTMGTFFDSEMSNSRSWDNTGQPVDAPPEQTVGIGG